MAKKISKNDLAKLPFRDTNLDIETRVEDLLNRLTLEEKFTLCFRQTPLSSKTSKKIGYKTF